MNTNSQYIKQSILVVALLLASTTGHTEVQSISISQGSNIGIESGITTTLSINYNVDTNDNTLDGFFAVRLFYDSSQLINASVTNRLTTGESNGTGSSAVGPHNEVPGSTSNDDGDSRTDKYMFVLWNGVSWPGTSLPTTLFNLTFVPNSNLVINDTTIINFIVSTAVSGYTASAQSSTLTVSPEVLNSAFDYQNNLLTFTGSFDTSSGVDLTKFTIRGQGNATRILTTSSMAAINSQTQLTVTLEGDDVNAVKTLLNKDGSSAFDGTVYNLALASVWNGNISIANANHSITVQTGFLLDIDGDGSRLQSTDGILIIRFMGDQSAITTTGATTTSATRDNAEILSYLTSGFSSLDIDGDGSQLQSTDGILIIRFMGDQSAITTTGATTTGATRNNQQILDYLNSIF